MSAERNRTLRLTAEEERRYAQRLLTLAAPAPVEALAGRTICQDMTAAIAFLPAGWVDLLILDPPYNLAKRIGAARFRRTGVRAYAEWMSEWLTPLLRTLKPTASVYVCGDWLTSVSIHEVLERELIVRNRITWEREKGRSAKANWKNCCEDIWFATAGKEYRFDAAAVRLKRRVLAPYRADGAPKDWGRREADGDFRMTGPSNLWSDITVPFWSMPENTEHPTQKPEKLIAKLILASSRPGDMVLDPFLGSGTTSVAAKKLGRRFVGIEIDRRYCCLAEKRLAAAEKDRAIQGYAGGCFWERNTLSQQRRAGLSSAAGGKGDAAGPRPGV